MASEGILHQPEPEQPREITRVNGALGATFAGVDPIVTYYVCVVPTLPIIVERYR